MLDLRAIFLFLFVVFICVPAGVFAQDNAYSAQEVSEEDGIPVLIKHLPDWESVRSTTVFATNTEQFRTAVGERPILSEVKLTAGTEAVTAQYPAGRLVIIEYTNPQTSVEADAGFIRKLSETPEAGTVYRRVGNYSVFVFDAADTAAASALVDRVKYEKYVQWLGEDPFLLEKFERYFVTTTRDVFIATLLWIVSGFGLAILSGLVVGFVFYRFRQQKRLSRAAFSDAGGLTRLNLDELSEHFTRSRQGRN